MASFFIEAKFLFLMFNDIFYMFYFSFKKHLIIFIFILVILIKTINSL